MPLPQAQIPMPRFAGSLARQMAIDEYRSLVNRTAARENGRPRCLCLVAVGPDDGAGRCVLGSLDLRLPQEATGLQPPGVPEVHDVTTTLPIVTIGHLDSTIRVCNMVRLSAMLYLAKADIVDVGRRAPATSKLLNGCRCAVQGDPGGAFLVNVAVAQQYRGRGVGRSLIRAAVDTAGRRLLAKRLYTHVDCDNEAAWRLYQQQGFDVIDDEQCTLALPGEDGSSEMPHRAHA